MGCINSMLNQSKTIIVMRLILEEIEILDIRNLSGTINKTDTISLVHSFVQRGYILFCRKMPIYICFKNKQTNEQSTG